MLRIHSTTFVAGCISVAILWIAGCGGGDSGADSVAADALVNSISPPDPSSPSDATMVQPTIQRDQSPSTVSPSGGLTERRRDNPHPVVKIKTSMGDITLKLDAENAPGTVHNFLTNYVNRGFYDQTVFHYVDDGFMIAAGGYSADLTPKETGPEVLNEAQNGLKNKRYTVAMARHADFVNSATSQFFINLADNDSLDFISDESPEKYGYCVFGEVIKGQEIIDRIAKTPVHDTATIPKTPVTPVVIQTIVREE